MGKLGREASPEELASFQDSICSLTASQREGIAKEALDADTVSQLLSQHVQGMLGEGSGAEASQGRRFLLLAQLLVRNHIICNMVIGLSGVQ